MFSDFNKLIGVLVFAALLALGVLAGCQVSGPTEPSGSDHPPAENPGANGTLVIGEGVSIASIFREPQTVQDFVNRSHAVVIGTIAAISDPVQELPYGTTAADYPPMALPLLYLEATYYSIAIEEVLLDDGNIRAHPSLRLDGADNSILPRVGERFLFSLGRNPDSLSYGIAAAWMVLPLDGGDIRNFDGVSPGYAGVTDEASLVQAVKAAAAHYDFLPPNQWPYRFAANEGDSPATPAPPGGPGGGEAAPVGNTGGGSN